MNRYRLAVAVVAIVCGWGVFLSEEARAVYDLPSDRVIPWLAGSDQWNGGELPIYNQATCTGLTEGDGTTNNASAIQTCLNNAADNTAVYIPSGIYYINSTISIPSYKVLRGAKPSGAPYLPTADSSATTFKLGGSGSISLGSNETVGSNVALSSGYTKGSQTLVTSSSPGVTINDWVVITENADTAVPVTITGDIGGCTWCGGPYQNGAGTQLMAQFAQVTSVNGNTISISRPLYFTYKSNLNPVIKKITFDRVKAGLENIRLNGSYADHSEFISMEGSLFSWVKGVETYLAGSGSKASHVNINFSHGCEVRDSYFHRGRDSSSDRNYGIALFFWNSDHKIENNILRNHRHSIDYEGGGTGTAVLYNYIDDNYTDDTSYLGSARFNHGAHPYMNLYEGNVISHIVADNYWGSSSHFTLFRNHFWGDQTPMTVAVDGTSAKPTWGFTPVEIWKNQHYYSLVGNVLGISGKWQNPNWSPYSVVNANCSDGGYSGPYMISFGCNSNDSTYDAVARTSAVVHGNYDLKTSGVAIWDGGLDHAIRLSLYYSLRPSWWCSQTPIWPAIGPDVSGTYNNIPAQVRYAGGACTSTPDTEPPVLPANFNLSATSPSQSSITISWNPATDNVAVTGYLIERCQGSGCSTFTQVGTPATSPFVDPPAGGQDLTANTFYNYHVRATDAAGNLSGWSNVVGATTQAPDTQAPTAPASLSATVVSSSNINLTWTASTDNVGVTGYKVERCAGSNCSIFTEIGTPTATNYSDTGLTASTLYRYQVRAVDGAGNNSGYSNIASATTPQAPPTPTFVAEYETAWNSTASPKTTANFSVQSGDILVAYAVNESSSSTIATPPTGTLSGTWTLKQTISATNFTALRLWSMNVTSNQNNVNVSFTNASGNWGADVLHFRNASSVGITAQANSNTGNPTLTLNGISENSSIVMVNGDWSARTGARTYNTTQAGAFTETSAYADGTSYGLEAGYYANAGASGNKTIGLTAPTGMTWALAALEVKGNPTAQPISCNTVTTANFSQAAYNSYGAPYDAFQTSTNLMDAKCTTADTHTINLTTGVTGDTTRIVYTKGYWYDAVTTAWRQYTGTCTGALNGEWCQGSVSATITDTNVSTASSTNPTYLVGMTCSVQGGSWKCGCRDTSCTNFSWQIQGAGL